MSQTKGQAVAEESFTEADVADYLRSHPDFFERHLTLLRRLRIPHQSGSATVSLVERQVSVLRQRNDELEGQLEELFDVAKANNALVDNIHELAMTFLKTTGIDERLEALENALREKFGAERAVLVLFNDQDAPAIERPGFVKNFDRNDEALKPFATFLRSAVARCGTLRDKQKELLFDREAASITSAAMVPIGEGGKVGFLTVGSKDANQFHPGQRVDFLGRLGELIAMALESGDERDDRR
ncbi:MAG: DUF484 family protein [Gammaproteobacteria bacterium]|nr:DUF484 family protein [Gammaproteobacteria bacterium]